MLSVNTVQARDFSARGKSLAAASNAVLVFNEADSIRILVHVEFDLPDAETRARLWRHLIPDEMPLEPDLAALHDRAGPLAAYPPKKIFATDPRPQACCRCAPTGAAEGGRKKWNMPS